MVLVCQFWDGIPSFRCKVPPHIHGLSPTARRGDVVFVTGAEATKVGGSCAPLYDHVSTPPGDRELHVMIPDREGTFLIGQHVVEVE